MNVKLIPTSMSPTLNEICRYMFSCAEKIEEEIKININDCLNMVTSSNTTDFQILALEKVKDNHYKEILNLLSDIITNVRKIIYHEEYIKKLDFRKSNSIDEISKCHYASVQNLNSSCHVKPPTSASMHNLPAQVEKVVRRERRRAASEISVYSLDAWESYLNQKESEASIPDEVELSTVGRRNKSKRKQKKFVSSTFNGFLDDSLTDATSLQLSGSTELPIEEEIEDELTIDDALATDEEEDQQGTEYTSSSEHIDVLPESGCAGNIATQSSEIELVHPPDNESVNDSDDTKPKIVDVLLKKTT